MREGSAHTLLRARCWLSWSYFDGRTCTRPVNERGELSSLFRLCRKKNDRQSAASNNRNSHRALLLFDDLELVDGAHKEHQQAAHGAHVGRVEQTRLHVLKHAQSFTRISKSLSTQRCSTQRAMQQLGT